MCTKSQKGLKGPEETEESRAHEIDPNDALSRPADEETQEMINGSGDPGGFYDDEMPADPSTGI